MQPWFRNIVFSFILLMLIVSGYFIFQKTQKVTEVQTPVLENVTTVTENSNNDQQEIEQARPQVAETVAVEPKKEDSTPPPEPPLPEGTDRFIVSLSNTSEGIIENLLTAEFITDTEGFIALLEKEKSPVVPGAYKLSKAMTPVQINKVLHSMPYMKWVVIKEGLRKEEIADLLATTLGWTKTQKSDWINKDTTTSPEYTEGVYYPDTYLIPVDEEPALVAKRLIAKFNEKFASYLPAFTAKNIKWARALTLASIVQREASSNTDMPLISGILWNRLDQGIALGVDATLQYVRGDVGAGWWAPISVADKKTDSPFNTYKYKGLPPHPISNPGVPAIESVLNPTVTDCVYYIHDRNRMTHCAVTYEEHKANIQKYLIENTTGN